MSVDAGPEESHALATAANNAAETHALRMPTQYPDIGLLMILFWNVQGFAFHWCEDTSVTPLARAIRGATDQAPPTNRRCKRFIPEIQRS
jgi:hypothetical protein